MSKFEDMGIKTEKLRELREHLQELGRTLIECKSALEDCDRALKKTKDPLMKLHQELHVFLGSFDLSIQKLKQSSSGLEVQTTKLTESISDLEKLITGLVGGTAGGAVGALAGGTLGAFGGPVGALMGVLIGGVVGAVKGAEYFIAEQLKQHRRQLKTLNSELTASQKIARDCQRTEQTVQQLLRTFSEIKYG